jgi:uncharacterized membrane protein YebE (DUF533 family)
MNMGDLIGAMLQDGLGGQGQARLRRGADSVAAPGGGLEDLMGALGMGGDGPTGGGNALNDLAASAGRTTGRPSPSMGGGLGDLLGGMAGGGANGRGAGGGLGDLLGQMMRGGMGGGGMGAGAGGAAMGGGLGDLLGGLLGGGAGTRRAAGGGAMAMLAGLAVQALKSYMASPRASAGSFSLAAPEAAALVDEDAEKLALRAMLDAAKADGRIDAEEAAKLNGKLAEGGVDAEERAFVEAELRRPCDPAAIAADVRHPAQGAQVYAAALLAIAVDTEAERAYLRTLADALRLPAESVAELHRATGAPAP